MEHQMTPLPKLLDELPLLLKYDGADPNYVQRRLEEAATALRAAARNGEILRRQNTWMQEVIYDTLTHAANGDAVKLEAAKDGFQKLLVDVAKERGD